MHKHFWSQQQQHDPHKLHCVPLHSEHFPGAGVEPCVCAFCE
jgi:hypothetical protein